MADSQCVPLPFARRFPTVPSAKQIKNPSNPNDPTQPHDQTAYKHFDQVNLAFPSAGWSFLVTVVKQGVEFTSKTFFKRS